MWGQGIWAGSDLRSATPRWGWAWCRKLCLKLLSLFPCILTLHMLCVCAVLGKRLTGAVPLVPAVNAKLKFSIWEKGKWPNCVLATEQWYLLLPLWSGVLSYSVIKQKKCVHPLSSHPCPQKKKTLLASRFASLSVFIVDNVFSSFQSVFFF